MSKQENQMFTGEIVFLDLLVVLVASTYWYITGHYTPPILGFVFLLIFLSADKFYFVSLVMGIITLLSIILFIFLDNYFFRDETAVSQVGISVLYILVIYLKARSIFNAD
ncbi:MAG: hypothetical protein DRG78_12585 [Epsilonproteobacteria bacterium]|nr:MAG: hypothetical protein DRG78_12585 [Campylobacterota bacterium]